MVNHHAVIPSKDGTSGRHMGLAKGLPAFGWEASLLVAGVDRRDSTRRVPWRGPCKVTVEDGVQAVWVPAKGYASNGLDRVASMAGFATNVLLRRTTKQLPEPDVVIGSTVHLAAAWAGLRLARRYHVPFVFEVRDVWPETLIDLGSLRQGSVVARTIRLFAIYLCKQADLVMSPLPGVRSYLDEADLPEKPYLWISNGIDPAMDITSDGGDHVQVDQSSDEFIVMYLGAHGNANGVDRLLDAFERACQLQPDTELRLRLVGEGSQKERLRAKAKKLNTADRITFEDRVPRAEVVGLARQADALIVNIEDLPVYRFGISLNKIFDYLLAGRPVIIATSGINDPVKEAEAGISVPAGDVEKLSQAICDMTQVSAEQRREMGRNGRAHVLSNYAYPVLAENLSKALDWLVDSNRTKVK